MFGFDDYDDPDYDPNVCPECGDEGTGESMCPDDLCHGNAVPCMHGDNRMIPCQVCGN